MLWESRREVAHPDLGMRVGSSEKREPGAESLKISKAKRRNCTPSRESWMCRSPEAGAGNLLRVVAFGWPAELEVRIRDGSREMGRNQFEFGAYLWHLEI